MHADRPLATFAGLILVLAPLGVVQAQTSTLSPTEVDDAPAAGLLDEEASSSEQVIVMTEGPPDPVADRAADLGAEIVWRYDLIDGFSANAHPATVDAIRQLSGVDSVWPSVEVHALLNNSVEDVRATSGWNQSINGSNVSVAILDTGIERTDPAFFGSVSACVATIGGVVAPECSDSHGHGTHVSGIAASQDETYKGVAHGADIAAVRVLHAAGGGTMADVIAGLEWVAENKETTDPPIRVASLSLGTRSEDCGDGTTPAAQAADALVAAGVNVTVAAGNSGHDECTVSGLAAAEDVITVGAVDDRNTPDPADDTLAEFSSGGPTTDDRIKPELVAPGVRIWSVFLGPTIANLDGTSMATPHVAGAVAMLAENEPGMTPAEVKDRLTNTATAPDNATDLPNNDWGYGLLDVEAALGLGSNSTSSPSASSPGTDQGHGDEPDQREDRSQADDQRRDDERRDHERRNRSSQDEASATSLWTFLLGTSEPQPSTLEEPADAWLLPGPLLTHARSSLQVDA